MKYQWNDSKNRLNILKHGISFEEASEIFENDVVTRVDDRYGYGEIREISIGSIGTTLVIVVVHTERSGNTRIISARKANKKEREVYYEFIKKKS